MVGKPLKGPSAASVHSSNALLQQKLATKVSSGQAPPLMRQQRNI